MPCSAGNRRGTHAHRSLGPDQRLPDACDLCHVPLLVFGKVTDLLLQRDRPELIVLADANPERR